MVFTSSGLVSGMVIRTSSPAGTRATSTQWFPTTSMSLMVVPGSGVNKGTHEVMEGSDSGVWTTWGEERRGMNKNIHTHE